MSKFIYYIHYRPEFKISEPDGLSRGSGEEEFEMDAQFFDEGQLLDLENNNAGEEEDAEDMKLEGIRMGTWKKKNGL